jgi:hypothetical protein
VLVLNSTASGDERRMNEARAVSPTSLAHRLLTLNRTRQTRSLSFAGHFTGDRRGRDELQKATVIEKSREKTSLSFPAFSLCFSRAVLEHHDGFDESKPPRDITDRCSRRRWARQKGAQEE